MMSGVGLCVSMSSVLGSYKKYVESTPEADVNFFVSVFKDLDTEMKCQDFEEAIKLIKSRNYRLNRQDMILLKEKGTNGFNIGVIAAISLSQSERHGFLADFAHIGGVEVIKWLVQDSAKDFADISKLYQIASDHASK